MTARGEAMGTMMTGRSKFLPETPGDDIRERPAYIEGLGHVRFKYRRWYSAPPPEARHKGRTSRVYYGNYGDPDTIFGPVHPNEVAWAYVKWYLMCDEIGGSEVPDPKEGPAPDLVNSPPHYNQGEVECIQAIRSALTPEEYRGYLKGNIMKYIWRERMKPGVRKAEWYIKELARVTEGE